MLTLSPPKKNILSIVILLASLAYLGFSPFTQNKESPLGDGNNPFAVFIEKIDNSQIKISLFDLISEEFETVYKFSQDNLIIGSIAIEKPQGYQILYSVRNNDGSQTLFLYHRLARTNTEITHLADMESFLWFGSSDYFYIFSDDKCESFNLETHQRKSDCDTDFDINGVTRSPDGNYEIEGSWKDNIYQISIIETKTRDSYKTMTLPSAIDLLSNLSFAWPLYSETKFIPSCICDPR
ncbi:MAG: hypothetical protein AB9907_12475 [Flexilinea sp.]